MFFEKPGSLILEKQVAEQLLSFNTDSLEYIDNMVMQENWQGNYQAALSYGLQAWNMDSTDSHCNLILGLHYYYLDDFTTALKYIRLYEKNIIQESGELRPSIIAGQVYLKNGTEEKARYHLEGGLSEWFKQIELNTPRVQTYYPYIELADVYLALGDQEKAWEYLNMLKGLKTIDLVYLTILKNWPGFDLIRNEPQFLEVLNVVEETYQKEHNRIQDLLLREGMIKS